ncbi:MAG: PEP-CTERM sorting domain-containing protein, partial [Planctomycetaceae bacterium]
GDTFAFEQRSGDSIFGRGVLTLSTFSAFAAVPEPASIIPVAVGFAAFGLRAFRRRRAVQAG